MKPQDVLPDQASELPSQDGITLRKGTIYASLLNAESFSSWVLKEDSQQKSEALYQLYEEQKELIPALKKLGLFSFFSPLEWLGPLGTQGRYWIAILYLSQFPEEMDAALHKRLEELSSSVAKELQQLLTKFISTQNKGMDGNFKNNNYFVL